MKIKPPKRTPKQAVKKLKKLRKKVRCLKHQNLALEAMLIKADFEKMAICHVVENINGDVKALQDLIDEVSEQFILVQVLIEAYKEKLKDVGLNDDEVDELVILEDYLKDKYRKDTATTQGDCQ